MSRCFPFPPPGYEKEARPDDVDAIVKEKHKRKRHKDKKDKVKKDKSEKKEKEREGKDQEDEDRKQKKQRDKKDSKKDKEKFSEEKQIVGSLENQNGGKSVPDIGPTNGIQDCRILVELGKRVRNDDGATDSQMVQEITPVDQRKANFLGKARDNSDGLLFKTLDISVEDKRKHGGMANGLGLKVVSKGLEKIPMVNGIGENQNKVENGPCRVDKAEERKERKENKTQKDTASNGERKKDENREKHSKTEKKKRKKEKKKVAEMSMQHIEQRESHHNFPVLGSVNPPDVLKESRAKHDILPKRKEPEFDGHDNGFRPNNISRPASSSHQVSQNGSGFNSSQLTLAVEKGAVVTNNHNGNGKLSSSQSSLKSSRNMESVQMVNNFTAEHGRASSGLISSHLLGLEGNSVPYESTNSMAKVKQGVVNNFKVDIKASLQHPLVENGSNGKTAVPILDRAAEWQKSNDRHKMDDIGPGIKSMVEDRMNTSSRPPSAPVESKDIKCIAEDKMNTSARPPSALLKSKETANTSVKKSPHPDLKYLSKLLDVPTVELPHFDDQEWLFGCKKSQVVPKSFAASQIELPRQVWAEAIHMECSDVTALPYVIPY